MVMTIFTRPRSGSRVARDQLPAPVVAVRVVRLQHPQPVPDGEAGGDDQEPAGEPPALSPPHRVDGLPRDQHGHHHGLAGTRGEQKNRLFIPSTGCELPSGNQGRVYSIGSGIHRDP